MSRRDIRLYSFVGYACLKDIQMDAELQPNSCHELIRVNYDPTQRWRRSRLLSSTSSSK